MPSNKKVPESAVDDNRQPPDVIPLVTLAERLGVPVSELLDDAGNGLLRLALPWSLCSSRPLRETSLEDQAFRMFHGLGIGQSPAEYAEILQVNGGSDALHSLTRAGGVVEVTELGYRDQADYPADRITDLAQVPVRVSLGDLLVELWVPETLAGLFQKLCPVSRGCLRDRPEEGDVSVRRAHRA